MTYYCPSTNDSDPQAFSPRAEALSTQLMRKHWRNNFDFSAVFSVLPTWTEKACLAEDDSVKFIRYMKRGFDGSAQHCAFDCKSIVMSLMNPSEDFQIGRMLLSGN